MGVEQLINHCEVLRAEQRCNNAAEAFTSTGEPGHCGVNAGPKATRLPSAAPRGELRPAPHSSSPCLRLASFVSIPERSPARLPAAQHQRELCVLRALQEPQHHVTAVPSS